MSSLLYPLDDSNFKGLLTMFRFLKRVRTQRPAHLLPVPLQSLNEPMV